MFKHDIPTPSAALGLKPHRKIQVNPCQLDHGRIRMSTERIVATFICLWLAWVLFTASLDPQELVVGAICSALVAGISYGLFLRGPVREKLQPKRWAYLLAYLPVYIWAEIKAHLNVAYRTLHPKLPLKPAIVRVPTELRSDVGLTTLANSITMTPGTLSVEVNEEKPSLYVHWINAETLEPEEVKKKVGGPFERFLKEALG